MSAASKTPNFKQNTPRKEIDSKKNGKEAKEDGKNVRNS